MSNLQRHKDCPMRSEIGNCLAIGGFCTSVSKETCEALQNAYTNGKHSVEVSEDAISRANLIQDLRKDAERVEMEEFANDTVWRTIGNAPSVVPCCDNEKSNKFQQELQQAEVTTEQPSMVGEWIPCSERLPTNDDWVIVSVIDETGDTPYRYSDFGWYFERAKCWIVESEQRTDVVAWMLLPKPFKKDERIEE